MKSSRIISILVIVCLAVSFGFITYETFWGPDRLQLSGKSLLELLKSGDLWKFLVFSIVLIGFGVLELIDPRTTSPPEIKNGITAQARVLKVWDTGVTINDDPQVGLLLEVAPAEGNPSFQAKAEALVSRLEVSLVRPGITAEVKYDPQKPQRLQVLTVHVQDAATADAATRLEQLDELRDQGLISEEEYRQKREDILETR